MFPSLMEHERHQWMFSVEISIDGVTVVCIRTFHHCNYPYTPYPTVVTG
jgi:hypothetical protein